MAFTLNKYALVRDGYIVAFADNKKVSLKSPPKVYPEPFTDEEWALKQSIRVDLGLEVETRPVAPPPEPQPDMVLLPVVADDQPTLGFDERMIGPNYEVLADRVRAYWSAIKIPPEEMAKLTFAQLLIGLVAEGWITEAEGDGWLTGTLPAPVLAVIATLPQAMRFPAKARAIRPSEVLLSDPLVQQLGAAQGKSPQEMAAFFAKYAAY